MNNKEALEFITKIEVDIVNSEATKFERDCLLILVEGLRNLIDK